MTPLKTRLLPISEITPGQKKRMFQLMDAYYGNVTWDQFLRDLTEKQWVLVLEKDEVGLVGFSTQKFFTQIFKTQKLGIVFSGDTVIHHAYRNSQSLAWAFGRFMWEILQQEPTRPLYWMLVTKGIRTYRYLPLYFQKFFPRFDQATPPEYVELMNNLGKRLFSKRYDPVRGILVASESDQYLRDFDTPERDFLKKHSHYRFFYERNPGYRQGEELLCLAPFKQSSVRVAVWKIIEQLPPLLPMSKVLTPREEAPREWVNT